MSRSLTNSVFVTGITENRYMIAAWWFSFILLVMAVFIPGFRDLFDMTPLNYWQDWVWIAGGVIVHIIITELLKMSIRFYEQYKLHHPRRVQSQEIFVTN